MKFKDLIEGDRPMNTYDPGTCRHCGADEVTYNDLVGDASCASCGKWQLDEGDKPYATMKDGPDKYLFRKDGKQKLVGSEDNEPEEGQEELEEDPNVIYNVDGFEYRQREIEDDEGFYKKWHYMVTPDGEEVYIDYTPYDDISIDEFKVKVEKFKRDSLKENDMTDELNELRKAAGLPLVENDKHRDGVGETECKYCSSKDCDYDCDESQADGFEESVDEGKLPDALKKHQFGAKDDDSDDNDSDDDKDDDKEEVDEEVSNWMKRFDRLSTPVNEDCPTDPEENADGECSPFTHADDNVKMVREDGCEECNCDPCECEALEEGDVDEDFLIPPREVDDDGWDNSGNVSVRSGETDISSFDRDMSDSQPFDDGDDYADDERALDETSFTRRHFREIADIITKIEDPEVRLSQAEHYAAKFAADNPRFNRDLFMTAAGVLEEHGPGDDEFSHDEDAMVDVGDESFSDDSEDFSDLGSGDYYGDSQYYETIDMGDLRRLAGLEPLAEEKVDEFVGALAKGAGAVAKGVSNVAKGVSSAVKDAATAVATGAMDEEEVAESEPHNTGDYSAFDFANEQAYYLVSDEIGDRVQFGDHDEVLVPDALADGILVLLAKNGFEKGQDFSVAGMDEDLQNGYNNRDFIDGQDLFPRGANNQPADDLGPTASGFGDNAMKNRMRSKNVADVYESMKLSYRRFRKS